jgi:hypothetical protein
MHIFSSHKFFEAGACMERKRTDCMAFLYTMSLHERGAQTFQNNFVLLRAFNGMDKDGLEFWGKERGRDFFSFYFHPHDVVFFLCSFYSSFTGVGRRHQQSTHKGRKSERYSE